MIFFPNRQRVKEKKKKIRMKMFISNVEIIGIRSVTTCCKNPIWILLVLWPTQYKFINVCYAGINLSTPFEANSRESARERHRRHSLPTGSNVSLFSSEEEV